MKTISDTPRWDAMISSVHGGKYADGSGEGVTAEEDFAEKAERLCKELERKLAIHEQDLKDAAGEILVPIPEPGSVGAKILAAIGIVKSELRKERKEGQDVHDYLIAINPDNQHLSVMEAVIEQRRIENRLRERLIDALSGPSRSNVCSDGQHNQCRSGTTGFCTCGCHKL